MSSLCTHHQPAVTGGISVYAITFTPTFVFLQLGCTRLGPFPVNGKLDVRPSGEANTSTYPHVVIKERVKEGRITILQAIEIDVLLQTVVF